MNTIEISVLTPEAALTAFSETWSAAESGHAAVGLWKFA